MTHETVFVLCAAAALSSSAFTAVLLLLRARSRDDDRIRNLESQLADAQGKVAEEARASSLALERVASDHMKLEEKRIESGRLVLKVEHSLADLYEDAGSSV